MIWRSPVAVGDAVTVVIDGTVHAIDHDSGRCEVRGCARPGHVLWSYVMHWGTDFHYPVPGPTAAPGAPQDAEGSPSTPEGEIGPQSLVERMHAEHLREFPWLRGDELTEGVAADQCGNCQRWAHYAALADPEQAVLRADLVTWKKVAFEIEDDRERCARGWDAAVAALAARDAAIRALADEMKETAQALHAEGLPEWATCTLLDAEAVRAILDPDDGGTS